MPESGRRPRRLAVVSFYFPPAGAAGSLRVSSFVRYVAGPDWLPTVITTGELGVVFEDRTLLDDLPSDVQILRWFTSLVGSWAIRKKAPERPTGSPQGSAPQRSAWMRKARATARKLIDTKLFVPDHAVVWSIATGFRLGLLLRRTRTKVLLTSSPPHSLILTGWIARLLSGAAWIADLRDPWGGGDRLRRRAFRDRVGFGLETLAVRRADRVLANTQQFRDYLVRLAPDRADRIVIVPNGYDEEEIAHAKSEAATHPAGTAFRIVHAGALYKGLREPSDVLEAMARVRELTGGRDIRLELPGDSGFHHDAGFLGRIAALGLSASVEFPGYVSHAAVLRKMASANVLLLIQGGGFPMQIPSKAYEYLAMGRPILAVTPEGATADLVRRSPLGTVVRPGDVDAIVSCLQRVLRGELENAPSALEPAASRRELALRLIPILDKAFQETGA